MQNNAAQTYFQTQINTTSRGDVIVLLYSGAIRFLQQAKEKMLEKDMGAKGNLISKAMDIINELDSSLNMQVEGDLAQNLHNLYMFCSTRLFKANMHLKTEYLDEVIHILSELKYSFEIIAKTPEAQAISDQLNASQKTSVINRNITSGQDTTSSNAGKFTATSAYALAAKNSDVNVSVQIQNTANTAPKEETAKKEVSTDIMAMLLNQQAQQPQQPPTETAVTTAPVETNQALTQAVQATSVNPVVEPSTQVNTSATTPLNPLTSTPLMQNPTGLQSNLLNLSMQNQLTESKATAQVGTSQNPQLKTALNAFKNMEKVATAEPKAEIAQETTTNPLKTDPKTLVNPLLKQGLKNNLKPAEASS